MGTPVWSHGAGGKDSESTPLMRILALGAA